MDPALVSAFQEAQEEALGEVLGLIGIESPPSHVGLDGDPVGLAEGG
jgi:hypothetical protein